MRVPATCLIAIFLLATMSCSDDEQVDPPAASDANDVVADAKVADGSGPCEVDGDCPDLDEPCQLNKCDAALGCIAVVRPAGALCAHSNPCVEGGVCNKVGKCDGAAVKACEIGRAHV